MAAAIATSAALAGPHAGGAEPIFCAYQRRWIADQSRLRIAEKSRRIGWDWCEAWDVVDARLSGRRACDYLYMAQDEDAAREFADYVRHWAQVHGAYVEIETGDELYDREDLGVFRILLPTPGGQKVKVLCLTSAPTQLRSKGGDVTISEYAFHPQAEAAYKAAYPCTTWGGRLSIYSTHNGVLSHFHHLVEGAKRHADPAQWGEARPGDIPLSNHRCDIYAAAADGLVSRINRATGRSLSDDEFLAELRAGCDSATWREEYECLPQGDARSWITRDLIAACPKASCPVEAATIDEFVGDLDRNASDARRVVAGCDVGRTNHPFALWVLARGERAAWDTPALLVWRGRKFADMESALTQLLRWRNQRGTRVRRCLADATGIGKDLAERMQRSFPSRFRGVDFTNPRMDELAKRLLRYAEQAACAIPDDAAAVDDLMSVSRTRTKSGASRYAAPETADGHGDRFWALALACAAADEGGRSAIRSLARKPRGVP